jgi:hypothetical protein
LQNPLIPLQKPGIDTNSFGLQRHISKSVKRIIRKNSGFGCVICGKAIVHYDHVDPDFTEANEHDPTKMTLCFVPLVMQRKNAISN